MYKILILTVIACIAFPSVAQQQPNSWQEHLSFANGKKIAVAQNKIYCVTEGGLIYFNTNDNSLNKITRVNGLNDFGIRTIAWSDKHQMLVVAYENSNIDLIRNNTVTNLSDIQRKQMTGDMNIYNITIRDDEAFLSCGFGVVIINLARREIKDTWYIGPNGSALKVNDVEVFDSFVYAATDNGLFKADIQSQNLADYHNWEIVNNIPQPDRKFNFLMAHGGLLIANYTPDEWREDIMFGFDGMEWGPYIPSIKYISDAQVAGDFLLIASRYEVYIVDRNHAITEIVNTYAFTGETVTTVYPRSASMGSEGTVWIADNDYGLVRVSGQNTESYFPEGPSDNLVFSLYANKNNLWVAPGGRTDAWVNIWQAPRIQHYSDRKWNTLSQKNIPEMEGFQDIVEIVAHPSNPNHLFVASWGGGVMEILNGEFVNRYTNKNSPLQTALPLKPDDPYVRIGGLDFDTEGNLWITNSEVEKNLHKLSPDGKWDSYTMAEITKNNIGKVIVTQNNDKWIQVPRGNDLYVVNKDASLKKKLQVTSYFNNGKQEIFNRMSDVYSIVEDHRGAIWVGTSKGVAVYNNPRQIWDSGTLLAIQPSLDLRDGNYHPLLETEVITAIAVDGANRKWIGTRNSGVYLVSETGENEIIHFTADNSPLLANNITALAINQGSGEVFIGTSAGLISYKGDAISGKNTYANVYVYPNPVRETWKGAVTITGLVADTDIKITDINGNLVHQTKSLGGQAEWDGKNLNGNRVKTGIYLILCTDKMGEQTHIEKLLFIH